jgi:hypothetical protein
VTVDKMTIDNTISSISKLAYGPKLLGFMCMSVTRVASDARGLEIFTPNCIRKQIMRSVEEGVAKVKVCV